MDGVHPLAQQLDSSRVQNPCIFEWEQTMDQTTKEARGMKLSLITVIKVVREIGI